MLLRKLNRTGNEPDNTGRYLITYADLITLLLGLFVILYATAQVDEEKFQDYAKAFTSYFKSGSDGLLDGSDGLLDKHRGLLPEPRIKNLKQKSIEEVQAETEKAFEAYIKSGTIKVRRHKGEVIVTLSEKLLFRVARADVRNEGVLLLDTLSGALKGINLQITVDGHTDASPISTARFKSNWHLSAIRAANVGYLLVENGVPEENLVVRGLGAQRPIADNISEEGKSKNRRVEIAISEKPQDALSTEGYEKTVSPD